MSSSIPELAKSPLPLLPHTAATLNRLLSEQRTRTPDLQQVILRDPAAAIAIFRHLHRIKPGSTADVADVAHATSMIGFAAVEALLTGLPTVDETQQRQCEATRIHYAANAHAAVYARNWSEIKGLSNPQSQATAAVLQNPAPLVLAATQPEAALRAFNATQTGLDVDVAYRAEFRMDPQEINRGLAEQWGYPALAINAARSLAETTPAPNPAAALITLATRMSTSLTQDQNTASTEQLIEDLADLLGKSPDQCRAGLHALSAAAAREMHAYGFPSAAFSLVQEHREEDLSVEQLQQIDQILERLNKPAEPAIESAAGNPLQQAFSGILNSIVKQAGVERAVVNILSADHSELRARLAIGGDAQDPMRQLKLAMKQRHLFSLLIGKSQSIWVTDENRQKYKNLFPGPLASVLQKRDFFAMSLIVDERAIGIVYADGPDLCRDAYSHFRDQCKKATRQLSKNRKAA